MSILIPCHDRGVGRPRPFDRRPNRATLGALSQHLLPPDPHWAIRAMVHLLDRVQVIRRRVHPCLRARVQSLILPCLNRAKAPPMEHLNQRLRGQGRAVARGV